ncbi:MAG: GNAT family protein, partial [Desulfovibrionaceae bacterium]|nr:GNAT family protein [Desulfovibrionaceae bacterium]
EDGQGRLLACGLFSPWRGALLEFDFTTFRATAPLAVDMARQGFAWLFARVDCAGLVGICPLPNRHAWRLAEACGFQRLARLPRACFYARKGQHVDGLLFLLTREEAQAGPLQ